MAKRRARRLDVEFDISNSDIERLIDEWIHNERNRNILKRRFIDGVYIDELAYEFGLSERQINNIIYRGFEKISTKM